LAGGKMVAKLARGLLVMDVKQEIACVGQVIGHKTRGEFRVALFDRYQDRLMKLQCVLQIDKLGGNHHHVEHCAVDSLKETPSEAIARGLKDGAMKEKVGGNEADAVVFAALKVDDGLP
jgi:hypothetical protein